MGSLLKNVIRKPHLNRLITTLTHQNQPQITNPNLLTNYQSIFNLGASLNPKNKSGFNVREYEEEGIGFRSTHLGKLQIYPSFSFGYFLNPIFPFGSDRFQVGLPVGSDTEHPGVMRADSVKKKRKKKMNKHKYKKLRKRLRRKTKT